MTITLTLPAEPGDIFAPEAAERLSARQIPFTISGKSQPANVIAATVLDRGRLLVVTLEFEPSGPVSEALRSQVTIA